MKDLNNWFQWFVTYKWLEKNTNQITVKKHILNFFSHFNCKRQEIKAYLLSKNWTNIKYGNVGKLSI